MHIEREYKLKMQSVSGVSSAALDRQRHIQLYLAALQQVEHERYACGDELRAVVRRADGGEL